MILSPASIEVLSDLIENRLAIMTIGDQNDLRDKIALKRALIELRGGDIHAGILSKFGDIPTRGRRRKVGSIETL